MKVTNWRKKIVAAVLASGVFLPAATYAVNIPLLDPGFDNAFIVPTYMPGVSGTGYAYANTYRTASPWVDDLDSPTSPAGNQRFQDDVASNWLYSTAYGEDGPPFRGTPKSGNQAMHG